MKAGEVQRHQAKTLSDGELIEFYTASIEAIGDTMQYQLRASNEATEHSVIQR